MPTVLRAAITAKQCLAKENKLASALMEESVTNLQLLACASAFIGVALMPALFGTYPVIGIVGAILAVCGTSKLAE